MKFVKLTVCLVTLLSVSPSAFAALGEMEKSEVRDGTMICLGKGSGLKAVITHKENAKNVDVAGNTSAADIR